MSTSDPPRLVVGVTSALTADVLLRGELAYLRERGFAVTLACGGREVAAIAKREGVDSLHLPLEREIHVGRDSQALVTAALALRKLRPVAVLASTPKAGLILTSAARVAKVPVRVYQLRGLRLESATGPKRKLLETTERSTMSSATHLLAVSKSLRRRIIELGLHGGKRITVLGAGSSHGVDLEHFERSIPAELPWLDDAPVLGFVGRWTRDKGLRDFRSVFERVAQSLPKLRGICLGDIEPGDPPDAETLRWLREHDRIHCPGHVADTAPYYSRMDLLVFPSVREGFPNAPLEAAACAVPTVGYAVTGTVDAVVDDETGSLVPFGEVAHLANAALEYLEDDHLRTEHGTAALHRVRKHFSQAHVHERLADYLLDLVKHL